MFKLKHVKYEFNSSYYSTLPKLGIGYDTVTISVIAQNMVVSIKLYIYFNLFLALHCQLRYCVPHLITSHLANVARTLWSQAIHGRCICTFPISILISPLPLPPALSVTLLQCQIPQTPLLTQPRTNSNGPLSNIYHSGL